jgi:hypothetical protein
MSVAAKEQRPAAPHHEQGFGNHPNDFGDRLAEQVIRQLISNEN